MFLKSSLISLVYSKNPPHIRHQFSNARFIRLYLGSKEPLVSQRLQMSNLCFAEKKAPLADNKSPSALLCQCPTVLCTSKQW